MHRLRLILPLLAAYGLLVAGGNTALYYLHFGDIEERMARATQAEITGKLAEFPDFEVRVHFDGRDGFVSGVSRSVEGLEAGQAAVEDVLRNGVAGIPHGIKSLTHDLKRRSSFYLYEADGSVYLRAFLPLVTLARLEEGIHGVRGVLPQPIAESGAESAAEPQMEAAVPLWQDKIGEFVAYFFQPGRADDAEIRVTDAVELRLAGEVQSEEERAEIIRYAKACFPNLVEKLDNRIRIAPRIQPFSLQVVEDIVALEGMVPSVEMQERLFEFLRSQGAPGQSFVNGLQVVEGTPGLSWLESKPNFFKDLLASIRQPTIVIGPRVVSLKGEAPSQKVADALVQKVTSQLSEHEVTVGLSVQK